MHPDELIRPWQDRLLADLPPLDVVDVHTHIGSNDPDGFRCRPEELVRLLEAAGADAVVFPMHEPEGYRAANDAVLAAAADSGGRLRPFCRVDPGDRAAEEARRALAAGARGIKLHPRAERFELSDPGVADVLAVADERRLPVIVHAGRGIPALGRDALELATAAPGARIILAHAGICDLGWIWRHAPHHPNLFFDTAWWNPADLLALFSLVPPGQVLFGSDTPYGAPIGAVTMALRCALQAGLSGEQVAAVTGGQLRRLLEGEEPLALGPAPGPGPSSTSILLERVFTHLVSAIGRMLVGDTGEESVALARLACEVGHDAPESQVCRSVLALLDRHEGAAALGRDGAHAPADVTAPGGRRFPGLGPVVIAAGVARTPRVPLPQDVESPPVDERGA